MNMIPKITIFTSASSPTEKQQNALKKFLELEFAPLIDSHHQKYHSWFLQNVKPVPHKLFNFDEKNIYYYEVDDLHEKMDFVPDFMIYWNEDDVIEEEQWQWIREWLLYHLCSRDSFNLTENIQKADQLMARPISNTMVLSKQEEEQGENSYAFRNVHVVERDTMLYEVKKPFTDLPYTSVIRNYSTRGHEAFFPTLYICQSWGVSRYDLPFLSFVWKELGIEGEFDMDKMLKEATERCYPSSEQIPEPEPEVYRRSLDDVLQILQCQEEGILCGHEHSEIPSFIKDRF